MTQKKKQDLKRFDGRPDELDPRYIFSNTHTQLLTEALNGEYSVEYLVKRELASRGVDSRGRFIGFIQAREYHQIEKE
jgi:hypothetical protein